MEYPDGAVYRGEIVTVSLAARQLRLVYDNESAARTVEVEPTVIPTVNGNTVCSFSTTDNSPQRKEARPLSHALTSD